MREFSAGELYKVFVVGAPCYVRTDRLSTSIGAVLEYGTIVTVMETKDHIYVECLTPRGIFYLLSSTLCEPI